MNYVTFLTFFKPLDPDSESGSGRTPESGSETLNVAYRDDLSYLLEGGSCHSDRQAPGADGGYHLAGGVRHKNNPDGMRRSQEGVMILFFL